MAYLTPNEGMAAAYATLAFFFVVATGVVSLPQFRHFLSSFDLLLTARKSMGWIRLGFSFFAGALGAWTVYSVPQVGADVGPWGIIMYAVALFLPYVILPWLAPRVLKQAPEGFTALDYAKKRYGTVMYYFGLLVSLFYLFIYMVAEYTSAGGAISALTNYTLTDWHVTIGVALVSATYTAYGGMATSILTDMVQGCVMFSLVVIGCAAGFHFSKTSASAIHHAARWSSVGFSQCSPLIIGVVASGLFDMTMWQRAYAAKSSRELWQASLLGALLIMPVMILFGISGIIGAVMNPADAATASYLTFFDLVAPLGKGWQGILIVMVVSLVCSTADSIQNAMTTMISLELEKIPWEPLRKHPLYVARFTALLIQGPALALALKDMNVLTLFLIADLVAACIAIPVFAGLWGFMTPTGAMWGCIAGFASVVVEGWAIRGNFAQGWSQFILPAGSYANETVVAFVIAVVFSGFVGFAVSAAERVYTHVVRTRRYVEMVARHHKVDLDAIEEEFAGLVDYRNKSIFDNNKDGTSATDDGDQV